MAPAAARSVKESRVLKFRYQRVAEGRLVCLLLDAHVLMIS